MKKILSILILILVFGALIYYFFFKPKDSELSLFEVKRGEVAQTVSETGQTQKGDKINLIFENSGKIEKIYVEVGDNVAKGKLLARLATDDLELELTEAKAALSYADANLNKLLAGVSPEELRVSETTVSNAQLDLDKAQTNLENVEKLAQDDLSADYEDALNVFQAAYLKAYNAGSAIDLIQRTYFSKNDNEGKLVVENQGKIRTMIAEIKTALDAAEANPLQENIDASLMTAKIKLANISAYLRTIREACDTDAYFSAVASADKTILDNHRSYIAIEITNISDSIQTIASVKLNNTSDINTAQAEVLTASGALAKAQDELNLLSAAPREEDVNLYTAQKEQAQSQVSILEKKIGKASLYSPIKGQITAVNKRAGEVVRSLQDSVIVLMPSESYEIDVDIYEEDVVRVRVGNRVVVSLVAFPEEIFEGEVVSIDPAEKLIDGVVYYKSVVALENAPEALRPGMTADLEIKTDFKENVLIVPEDALIKEEKISVEVFKDGSKEKREVQVGLIGNDNMCEIISGLFEGEKVILR